MRKEITIAMASFPPRKAGMLLTVAALLPQCDRLCLYLNGYDERPEELPQCDRLTVVLAGPSCAAPDKGSQGKHHWLDRYGGAYYLTVDDDILYPADYVEKMVAAIDRYSRKAIVTAHGSLYRLDPSGRIPRSGLDRAHKICRMYSESVPDDIYVHMCGNGCTGCCPSEIGMTCAASAGPLHSGDDGDYALFAQANSVPIVRMATAAGWLRPNASVWPIQAQHKDAAKLRLQDAKARSWRHPWRLFPGEIAPSRPEPPADLTPALVTVSMPTYGTPPELLRKAVLGVLGQDERRLRLLVVNDAGDRSCWDAIDDIGDARLTRLDMPQNGGAYACHAETLRRCTTEWWSPHDADDHCSPDRYAAMLAAAAETGDDVILGGYTNVNLHGRIKPVPPYESPQKTSLSSQIWYVTVWAGGLWRTSWLRKAGGVNRNFRVSYDSALQTLAIAFSGLTTVGHNGYLYVRRADSATLSPETGYESAYRKRTYARLDSLLGEAIASGSLEQAGRIMAAGTL